jgi:hypothetical protein
MNILSFNLAPNNPICSEILVAKIPFPNKTGPVTATLHDFIAWLQTGRITPYMNNRGGKTKYKKDVPQKFAAVASNTIKSIVSDFSPLSFGEVRFAIMSNGTLQHTTGHSRTVGLLKLYYDGKLSAEALATEINFMVVPEDYMLKDYIVTGQQTGHNTGQKVSNEDLAYGFIIKTKVYPILEPTARKFYEGIGKLSNFLSYLIYTLAHQSDRKWDYVDVYWNRRGTKELLNSAAGTIAISTKDITDIAKAMNSYYEVYGLAQKGSGGIDVFPLFKDSGWFGLYLTDRLTESYELAQSDKVLASQIVRNFHAVRNATPLLGGTTTQVKIRKACQDIFKEVKKKNRSKV